MKNSEILKRINIYLDGEMLRFSDVYPYLDAVIFEINSALQTRFPSFTDRALEEDYADDYTAFPDKYIANVIVPGVAYKYYVQDEEGENVAGSYGSLYQQNLFYMQRDCMEFVDEKYVDTDAAGYLTMEPFQLGGYNYGYISKEVQKSETTKTNH